MKLSLRELGKIIGVSGSAVSQWESGGNITWENRVSLSKILDIPISDFLPPGARPPEMNLADPREILLIQKYREVSERFREAYLHMLIVQAESPPEE